MVCVEVKVERVTAEARVEILAVVNIFNFRQFMYRTFGVRTGRPLT